MSAERRGGSSPSTIWRSVRQTPPARTPSLNLARGGLQALRKQPITLYGDGSQTRSFCYVSDLIDGIWRMMNTEGLTGPVNMGNPGEFSIRELAEMVVSLTGSRSGIVHHPLPQDDPVQRRPVISLAKERLGWQPTVPLREGLTATIHYFEGILSRG